MTQRKPRRAAPADPRLRVLTRGALVPGPPQSLDGVSAPLLITLRGPGGIPLRAVFKRLSSEKLPRPPDSPPYHVREIAAYRLSEALGLQLVPPTVERTIDGEVGSLQLFVEDVRTLKELKPARPRIRRELLDRLLALDCILANADRVSPGNILLGGSIEDGSQRIVAIDHAHTFFRLWDDGVFKTVTRGLLMQVETDPRPAPTTARWLASIRPERVERALRAAGIDRERAAKAAARARGLQGPNPVFAPES
jgi:hypothetical protein